MAQRDMLKRYLDAGMAFTAMTKSKAEGIVREMVKAGEVERDQVQSRVEDLIDRSRRNTDHLIALVRKEVTSQLADLGLTTWRDLEKLERRFRGATGSETKGSGAPEAQATEAPAKRSPGRPKGSGTTKTAAPKKAAPTKATTTKTKATTTKVASTKATTPKAAPTKVAATKKAAPTKAAPTKKAATTKRAPAKAANARAASPAPSDSPASGTGPSAPAS